MPMTRTSTRSGRLLRGRLAFGGEARRTGSGEERHSQSRFEMQPRVRRMSENDRSQSGAGDVAADAQACLRGSSILARHPISCRFREGTLTLRGRVPTYFLKQTAQEFVARVDGVKTVDNQLDVVPLPLRDLPRDGDREG